MEKDPSAILRNIAGGHGLVRSLHLIADFGVADALDEEPRTISELALEVGAHDDALGRILRLLAAHDIFAIQDDKVWHTPASRLLRTDHPQSMRALVRMFGHPLRWRTYEKMEHSLRTGEPATTQTVPQGFWGYMADHPEDGQIFNDAMQAKARGAIAGILASYDFSPYETIADIGGGHGHLLQAILKTVPTASGVVFDLPHAIAEVENTAHERLTLHAGDFFRDKLPSCDAYVLMDIIHDWGDTEAIAILRAVRTASQPGSMVLLIEKIVSANPGPDWAKMLDVHMLTMLGGRQRTQEEYVGLFNQAGFQFMREIDTGSGISILEAQAAQVPQRAAPGEGMA